MGTSRKIVWIVLAVLSAFMPARAPAEEDGADPQAFTGLWQTDEKGSIVELYPCAEDGAPLGVADRLCGRVARAKKAELNGRLVLVDFGVDGEPKVKGRIIDPRTGSVYRGRLKLVDAATLEVKGCLLFFCRTQMWHRIAESDRLLLAGGEAIARTAGDPTP